jgi:hypothetical protein
VKINDQLPDILTNIDAVVNKKPLVAHQRGKSFFGQADGPMMVAFGHGLDEGYGVGPALPGCMGCCCWVCCCCQTPAGHQTNKMKSDFNASVTPKKGKGIDR